ncbi:cation diffusion facilitator family transporter [Lactobacillaceae bacterium L1_55_11]|nr:cation diffusion facilitator family transporter [Lactobacillaceae bacterium L1_55_11]
MSKERETAQPQQWPYLIGITLNLLFVLTEIVFAKIAHSTALFADAFHNLSDVLALVIAWLAVIFFGLRATRRYTYGWHNVSILASIFNTLLLLGAVVVIFYEAIRDLLMPGLEGHPTGWMITVVAAVGIVINLGTALLFRVAKVKDAHGHAGHSHGGEDLNAKTAYIHLLSDAGVSIGVIVAGWLIQLTGWQFIDPLVSLAIGVIILISSAPVMKETLNLAVNGVPGSVDEEAIAEYLEHLDGVDQIHDLHIWPLSTTETALTVHLSIEDGADGQALLEKISQDLRSEYHIAHVTVQIEREDFDQRCNNI